MPRPTYLIVAATSSTYSAVPTSGASAAPSSYRSGSPSSTDLPATATIPSSIPTLIVPANSVVNNPESGTGSSSDPIKDDTLISILLDGTEYPWLFVVSSSDATSQLFNTFPTLIATALNIDTSDVQTYGLQVYQPASSSGNSSLLTQWLAYIPSDEFDTLNAYLKTQSSPLYNQTGLQGELAAQINTAYPLSASSSTTSSSTSTSSSGLSTRTRDIIIGVCVGIGGLLWVGLVYWIYKRVRRSNERAVHKRLSEHMSMFGDRDERRVSMAPSVAGSDVDDRPSSFYASPMDNDATMRVQQRLAAARDSMGEDSFRSYGTDQSPTYGPSVFGTSWFQNPQGQGQASGSQPMRQIQAQNPFEDMVTRSYLGTSGSGSASGANMQRRSAVPRPVQKTMIGQPTLHASSLEFRDY
ncbi:hypothetical protein EHS25_001502 [Saitozyma podzolica]|uniref:Mid2 domain-containing protein n=1 Tax=Saitozyma podzolica TaxID=1890683 RepID=A0A427YGE6_9TREE|nr:hypothetical protein EHS25_001502 [Saitozyma podzolica]